MLPKIFWSKFTFDIRKTLFVRKKYFEKKIFFWGGATLGVPDPQIFLVIFRIGRWKKNFFGPTKIFFWGGGRPWGYPPRRKKIWVSEFVF